ncbi:triphosphoribosyl-dephospho-CoA synthase [Duganella sp. CF402]|uniref:triphosphoribosyl-dephospho-CoA synthase MdcB n=1 Tax=unclassified Duganella TaxID=2636909 RepID=UPI0008BE0B26|nr:MULTISPECIES: triphosphoribosyl-dephospho-CoA synthase MdcB [unclassified Duganella]RZT09907.1 triphosphoribosyl-dephospho-CoA synthase [Duganella sp. BK701]SEL37604.1 triphosphoribosyl-dephospho-CoA synthase [Duganella sp. CF402]
MRMITVRQRGAAAQPASQLAGSARAIGRTARRAFARQVTRLAVRSLHAELCLYPKPGLVSPVDSGSHDDMDAGTFMHSMFALRHYFRKICLAGWDDAPFAQLKQLGIAAEEAMLKATRGINTHRGAIFSLGMLCAAAGRARAQGTPLTPAALRAAMLIRWGEELAGHAAPAATAQTNGLRVAARYAVSGAREEGALGLPSVFEVGLPALLAARARGASVTEERVDTLYTLMAHISDSNVYHRAGPQGAQIVRDHAERFLALGGTASAGWRVRAIASHHVFIEHRLSPGGAADLLAACCLVQAIAALDQQ